MAAASSPSSKQDDQYFSSRVKFITSYNWIWNVKMTRFFTDNHSIHIPPEWKEALKSWKTTGDNSSGHSIQSTLQETTPPSHITCSITTSHHQSSPGHSTTVSDYITTCRQLSASIEIPDHIKANQITVDKNIARGMSPKKVHEVSRLAGLVKQVCQETQCDSVMDVGSGLGYLGTCLVSQCGLHVTCIEGNEDRIESAVVRERRVLPRSCDSHMTTVSLTLDSSDETKANMGKLITNLSVPQVCLVGLHCCGDLTPVLLNLLTTPTCHPALTSAVIVSCCYHKMAATTHKERGYENFPLSQSLRRVMSCDDGCNSITPLFNAFALRLAAQESFESWQSQSIDGHVNHTKHVAYRAILETLLEDTGEQLPGKAHRKANYDSFEEYIISLNLKGISVEMALEKYEQFAPFFYLIEPFTALQYHMQRVLETVILMDRVVYLRENGLDVELVPVFDVTISPRMFAIVAKRKL